MEAAAASPTASTALVEPRASEAAAQRNAASMMRALKQIQANERSFTEVVNRGGVGATCVLVRVLPAKKEGSRVFQVMLGAVLEPKDDSDPDRKKSFARQRSAGIVEVPRKAAIKGATPFADKEILRAGSICFMSTFQVGLLDSMRPGTVVDVRNIVAKEAKEASADGTTPCFLNIAAVDHSDEWSLGSIYREMRQKNAKTERIRRYDAAELAGVVEGKYEQVYRILYVDPDVNDRSFQACDPGTNTVMSLQWSGDGEKWTQKSMGSEKPSMKVVAYAMQWENGENENPTKSVINIAAFEEPLRVFGFASTAKWTKIAPYVIPRMPMYMYVKTNLWRTKNMPMNLNPEAAAQFGVNVVVEHIIADVAGHYHTAGFPISEEFFAAEFLSDDERALFGNREYRAPAMQGLPDVVCMDDEDMSHLGIPNATRVKILRQPGFELRVLLDKDISGPNARILPLLTPEQGDGLYRNPHQPIRVETEDGSAPMLELGGQMGSSVTSVFAIRPSGAASASGSAPKQALAIGCAPPAGANDKKGEETDGPDVGDVVGEGKKRPADDDDGGEDATLAISDDDDLSIDVRAPKRARIDSPVL